MLFRIGTNIRLYLEFIFVLRMADLVVRISVCIFDETKIKMKQCKEVKFPICYSEFIDKIKGFKVNNRHGLVDTYDVFAFKHWGGIRGLKPLVSGRNF